MFDTAKRRVICRTSKEAIEKGNVIELQRIIQQGENINDVDEKFKFTPLHWASHFGALEVKNKMLFLYLQNNFLLHESCMKISKFHCIFMLSAPF